MLVVDVDVLFDAVVVDEDVDDVVELELVGGALEVEELVVSVVDVVVDGGSVARQVAAATVWVMRLLTTPPKSRSMFASPPARSWQ